MCDLLVGSIYCIEFANSYALFPGQSELSFYDLISKKWIEYHKSEKLFLYIQSQISRTYITEKTCLLYWISRNQQVEMYHGHIFSDFCTVKEIKA
jgi:hypothetical protein